MASSRLQLEKSREWWLLVGGGLQISYRLFPGVSDGFHDLRVVVCKLMVASDHIQ